MIRTVSMGATLAASALALAACNVRDDAAANQAAAGAPTPAATGVAREEVAREAPAVVPMAAPTVLQSQPGPDGIQVDLIKLAVTGDILTATFRCSSLERTKYETFDLAKTSLIDDATSQRIAVLRDNGGNWMASDPDGSAMVECETKPGVFWAKFPAPPATSKTVSINVPEVGPFDGVPVTR